MNKADKSRMQAIKDSGCICCLLATGKTQAPDVHHLTSGGRREGHQATLGLCGYHHRGLLDGQSKQFVSGLLGPSYAWGRKGFQQHFGTDEQLLKIQNMILERFTELPWHDYAVPYLVVREAKQMWATR